MVSFFWGGDGVAALPLGRFFDSNAGNYERAGESLDELDELDGADDE